MKLALATAFAALSLAGAAFADSQVKVTLDSTQAAPAKFIAAHAVWNCAGSTCVALAPDGSTGLSGCKDLAKVVGHIAAWNGETKSLDSQSLEKCNKEAATPARIGTASR